MSEWEKLSSYHADKKLFLGIDKALQLVKKFYGPKTLHSQAAFFEERGYTVLSKITFSDPHENIGVGFAKIMADKIYAKHFDGATVGLILLHAILQESYLALERGISIHKLSVSLKHMEKKLLDSLQQHSWPIKDAKKLRAIIFSALHIPIIADEFAAAFSVTGPEGLISLTCSYQTDMQITQGLRINAGYASAYFTSHSTNRVITISCPKIFITDKKISTIHPLLPLLQEAAIEDKHLLIFCEDIHEDVLATLIANKLQGLLQVTVISIPNLSTTEQAVAEDIALFTGTHIFSQDFDPHSLPPHYTILGSCASIEISETQTTLIRGHHVPEVLALKIRQLEEEIRSTLCPREKLSLTQRKNRLQSPVTILSTKESNKALYNLAFTIMSSAMTQGYIPGGGAALFYASLDLGKEENLFGEEEYEAMRILQKACCAPLEQLANNADLDSNTVIAKLSSLATTSLGVSVLSREIEDLIARGILDSLSTISSAVSYALDTALLVLSSKMVICEM
ncbi:variant chaperonin GroEL3 [Candidatus Chlamydia sanziniae]|uniref:60 kDa chaperonin n=1 Tax=Candidatus Chlamydia sanziniae TaxID=1806891 RepID=A0A1A9HVH7_9CHLA|nr:variant chaperonin GroEL3 [Candidatus Chlamydia sanziniae]ANH78697.1 Heat shock protein 60 family chaperone GroEL [Candidatus Chlamydia sanziniae]